MYKKLASPLVIVFITLLLDKLGENIIFPLLPYILNSYNPDGVTLGLIAATSQAVAVITGPIVGSLSDSVGRRPVIIICIALNFVSLLMFGWEVRPLGLYRLTSQIFQLPKHALEI